MGTKNNPGDEPMFVLLGRDPMAAGLVRLWAALRDAQQEHPNEIAEARACADQMEAWCRALGKTPVAPTPPDERIAQAAEKIEQHTERMCFAVEAIHQAVR